MNSDSIRRNNQYKGSESTGETEREKNALFADIGDGGQNRKRNEVAEDTEDELVDADVESNFGDNMISSVE